MKKVKQDNTFKEVGQGIMKIRRTMVGDMILVLNKASEEKITQFRTAIEGALDEEADVKSRVQQTTLEIKDLDEVTTKEEVCDVLQGAVGEGYRLELAVIKSGKASVALKLPW